ncbi:MAG: hypothetical protein ACO1OO_09610 [Flavisolibacter sp.]
MAYNLEKDKNPTCVNIIKLQRYNFKFFSLEEVVFFEYLVVKAKAFGFGQFYHSTETISSQTGIKRTKLDTIIGKFNKLGILHVEVKGFPKVKHFTVDFEQIQALLSQIYQSAENGKLPADMLKLLSGFYNPLVESYQKKNKLIRIDKENNKKEKPVGDTDWDAFGVIFNEFILDLKIELNLREVQCKYDEQHLYNLYSNYEQEVILENLRRYFKQNSFGGKVSDFLKTEKLSTKKNSFIEKAIFEEKKFAENLVKNLESIFNERRETNSTSKKRYSKTGLAINSAIIEKVRKVLKQRGEQEIRNSFIAYSDAIIKNDIQPAKILPYFFSENFGEYGVLDTYLDYFNVNYAIQIK